MSWLQRLVTRIAPSSWASSMEAESRAWVMHCPACGVLRSIRDLGGIRWKARGSNRVWTRCAACGRSGWQTLYRRTDEGRSGNG